MLIIRLIKTYLGTFLFTILSLVHSHTWLLHIILIEFSKVNKRILKHIGTYICIIYSCYILYLIVLKTKKQRNFKKFQVNN